MGRLGASRYAIRFKSACQHLFCKNNQLAVGYIILSLMTMLLLWLPIMFFFQCRLFVMWNKFYTLVHKYAVSHKLWDNGYVMLLTSSCVTTEIIHYCINCVFLKTYTEIVIKFLKYSLELRQLFVSILFTNYNICSNIEKLNNYTFLCIPDKKCAVNYFSSLTVTLINF